MNCAYCEKAIRDAVWGDLKCSVYEHYVYDRERVDCKEYKEGVPAESKINAPYEATMNY